MVRYLVASIVIVSVIACTGSTGSKDQEGTDQAATDAATAVVPPLEAVEVKPGYFTAAWALWRAPTDERNIPNPDGEGTIKNYLVNVDRGRPLERLAVEGDWSQVRLEDGTEGWIKTERIVTEEGARLATVLQEERMFKRPELLALVIDEKVPAGSLLITAGTDGKFTEVDVPTGKYDSERTWMLTENLTTSDRDIEAAMIIRRVLELRQTDKVGAAELADLARGQFAGSRLLVLLDVPDPVPAAVGTDGVEP